MHWHEEKEDVQDLERSDSFRKSCCRRSRYIHFRDPYRPFLHSCLDSSTSIAMNSAHLQNTNEDILDVILELPDPPTDKHGSLSKPRKVSLRYTDNQDGIPEHSFEENNKLLESAIKLPEQCVENQRGLHGLIVYDKMSYPIYHQPQAEPDTDDDGIDIHMEEDFC